jgi:hypothetical protein
MRLGAPGPGGGVSNGPAQPGAEVPRVAERAALSDDGGDPAQEVPGNTQPRPEVAHRGPAAFVVAGDAVTPTAISWPTDT